MHILYYELTVVVNYTWCQFQVFHAEKVEVNKKVYHKKCASCTACTKPLSSRDLCEGSDSNIYCTSCYSRKFGAPGYRGTYVSMALINCIQIFLRGWMR
jgi:hypothetical protein